MAIESTIVLDTLDRHVIEPATTPPMFVPLSAVPTAVWPAMPSTQAASLLAIQHQLDRSQWLSPVELQMLQLRQAEQVLRHAAQSVPFYRERLQDCPGVLSGRLTIEAFRSLPRLMRQDIQCDPDRLAATRLPAGQGRVIEHFTSGSSGMPIRTLGTSLAQFFWDAFTLRDHQWQQRALDAKLAAIRSHMKEGHHPGWSPSLRKLYGVGSCATLNIGADLDAQLDWLDEEQPAYLLSHPSNVHGLAKRSLELGRRLPSLRQVRTFGETLKPDLRDLCRQAWDAKVTDVYSTEEVGYIALQCPEYEHYHVQAENVLVEVLDDDGRACPPGQIGQVVVTSLHNFAMPLIRYQLNDYAEVGEACPCGRGLPVLKRILGRQRNMVVLPDGKRRWPSLPSRLMVEIAPVRQFQLIQKSLTRVEAHLVVERSLDKYEEDHLAAWLGERLGAAFQLEFHYVAEIPRRPNSKYEDFISEIA